LGLSHTLVGHSERRKLFGECNELLLKKTQVALGEGLNVVFCCGEQLADRESNKTQEVVRSQLEGLDGLSVEQWDRLVIAYEPVWAIGTGKVATPEQAQEVHDFIRKWVSDKVNPDVASKVRIIYGGSVKDSNCENLIKMADIDGFLVGGASLKSMYSNIVKLSVN
jgi:triosephosphate isomerase